MDDIFGRSTANDVNPAHGDERASLDESLADDQADGLVVQRHSERILRPWYKNPLQLMAMLSNFSTSFNVVNISLVLPMIEVLLREEDHHATNIEDESVVASSLLAGMILGQLVGGALGDSGLGLTGSLTLVMALQVVASLGSAAVPLGTHAFYWKLATWRLVLGVGAGAVYPLAACLSVEQQGGGACKDHEALRLQRVVWTFCMQGVGFWTVPALAAALLCCGVKLVLVWRILLGAGCVPGLVLLYFQYRLVMRQPVAAPELVAVVQVEGEETLPPAVAEEREDASGIQDPETGRKDNETGPQNDSVLPATPSTGGIPRTTTETTLTTANVRMSSPASTQQQQHAAATDMTDRELHNDSDGEVGTFLDSSADLDMSSVGIYRDSDPPVIRAGWWASLQTEEDLTRKLLGTAATWFLFDVLFYGNTLFQSVVIEEAFGSRESMPGHALIQRVVTDSLILNSVALPGYFVAALVIGRKTCGIQQSPRYVMMQGFAAMAILYFVIGVGWDVLCHFPILLVFVYGLTFFFANYGPNTTTFILPSLVYSAECRSTLNGVSAACGKVGALVGATLFAPLNKVVGEKLIMLLCAVTALVALGMTQHFVRPRQSPLTQPDQGRGGYSVVNEGSS
jgi:hypothetical protein